MLRRFIWLLVGLLALSVLALVIVTPTPEKGDGPPASWYSRWFGLL